MDHENEIRDVWPGAEKFELITAGPLSPRFIGWIFKIPKGTDGFSKWGWSTVNGEVSTDPCELRSKALRALKDHARYSRQRKDES